MKAKISHVLASSLVATSLLGAANMAAAQESAVDLSKTSAGDDQELTEITVTGSRIRGVGPVGTNVIAVDSDTLLKQPVTTVTDYLRTVPQLQGFGVDATSSSTNAGIGSTNNTRGSALDLRGLGPQATLTLIDGQRLTYSGTSNNFQDPSAIPTIAVEHIEVLADGSSAVYGSDAVAGVVNFILRKKFEGVEVDAHYGTAADYHSYNFSVLAGHDWGSGSVVAAVEMSRHNDLSGIDRDYIRSNLTGLGGSDFRNNECNPGTLVVNKIPYAIPPGGVTAATAGSLVANTNNLCENLNNQSIIPQEHRNSVYLYGEQHLSDAITFHVQGIFTNRDFLAYATQSGSASNLLSVPVPASNAYFVQPPGTTGAETVNYDLTSELGRIHQTGYTDTLHLTTGLDWAINDQWHADVTGVYSHDKSGQWARYPDTGVLTRQLASGDAATAFNPYGAGNSAAVLSALNTGYFNPFASSLTAGASFGLDGVIWTLPGGDMRLALGLEDLKYIADNGFYRGNLLVPSSQLPTLKYGSRTVDSEFGELFIPFFEEKNALPGLQRLELTVAGRHDQYSDVGGTTNPKIGFNYAPVKDVLLKGSWGTSFRAPQLGDLNVLRPGGAISVLTYTDPLSPTGTSNGVVINAGNPKLTPEKATTWSLTAEYKPSEVPGLRTSVTYFNINYRNQITYPPRSTSALLDSDYAFVVTRNPSAALIQSFIATGLPVNGVIPAAPPWLYDASARNLGSVKTTGLDFDESYRLDTAAAGAYTVGLNGTYRFKYDFAVTQLAIPSDQVGYINYPPRYSARAYLDWKLMGFDAEFDVNRVASYINNLATVPQEVSGWTTLDFHLSYSFPQEHGVLAGFGASFDVTNLTNKDAPFVNQQTAYDNSLASPLGRYMQFSIRKKF
jgi:iron complex outermembrane recepter protein